MKRVVVTGMGAITPIGNSVEEFWKSIKENKIGIDNIYRYEHELLEYAISKMTQIPGLRLIGTAKEKTSVLSFILEGFETQKVGEYLTSKGIALRFGHHCAQPILRRFGVETTVRPSIAFYNTKEEIDRLVNGIKRIVTMF